MWGSTIWRSPGHFLWTARYRRWTGSSLLSSPLLSLRYVLSSLQEGVSVRHVGRSVTRWSKSQKWTSLIAEMYIQWIVEGTKIKEVIKTCRQLYSISMKGSVPWSVGPFGTWCVMIARNISLISADHWHSLPEDAPLTVQFCHSLIVYVCLLSMWRSK